jgi:predicted Zn-dependent protease with MMP-like domain
MAGKKTRLSEKAFDEIVTQAIARIPLEIRRHLDNILITVEKRPDPEMLAEAGSPPGETLFGLYSGVPLTERSAVDPPLYPDTIFIFQEPLEQACVTREELIEEIEITVVHEVAHFLGLSDEELELLGYG